MEQQRMTSTIRHRALAGLGAGIAGLALTGVVLASTPASSHASSTAVNAVTNAGTQANTPDTSGLDAHGLAVSEAAQSSLTGGAHDNHGGYVSCIARGGSDCTSTTPTLPSHGSASGQAPSHSESDEPGS
jgi:hypothetical protein